MKDQIIHDKLDKLQFHSNLDDGRFLIFKITPVGYGASLFQRLWGLKMAYIFNRTVIFDYSEMSYLDLYQETSSIKIEDIKNYQAEKINFKQDQKEKFVYVDFLVFWKDSRMRHYIEKWLPAELARQGKTPAYFWGQLLLRLEPFPEYQEYVDNKKIAIGFSNPIIGIHIRRGDKNTESPYVPMRIYEYYLRRAIKETGIKKVFATSDCDDIFKELPIIAGVEYIYDKEERRYNNGNQQMIENDQTIKEQESLTALKIISLLGDCDYIIGQKNVNFIGISEAIKEAQGLKNRIYFVNRQHGDISLNNDPNIFLYIADIIKKQ